ncbi:MAG: IS200/IS605 family transposase [Bacteroidetes bacterium]|nr:IS200/IS605 family transposase [Bacteroidota bacterium]
MSKYRKQSHVVYKCDYHIVWVPKYRFKVLAGAIKELVDRDIRMICEWKNCDVEELNVQLDHVHLMVSVPPKVSISELMGTLKGKLAIKLFKSYPALKKKPYWGNHGLNEDVIRRYVKYQEEEERKEEKQNKDFGLFESTGL